MTEIVRVANTDQLNRTDDVVFLHGLDGDARLTWLGEDIPDVGVWGRCRAATRCPWCQVGISVLVVI